MYLRHSIVRKGNKTHTYWRLVRSMRRDWKVHQATVAQLGELDAEGRAKARLLARAITARSDEQRERFEPLPSPSARVVVDLPAVRLERGRRFGDVWLGHVLWQALRLDRFCQTHLTQSQGRAHVPWSTMAEILTVARLCEPLSELFDLDCELLLYDVTSTYFERDAKGVSAEGTTSC